MQEILSRTSGLNESWTIFPGDIEKRISENFAAESEIYGVFKVKKPKETSIGKCKM